VIRTFILPFFVRMCVRSCDLAPLLGAKYDSTVEFLVALGEIAGVCG